jgi:S1-C subfamily serine protease
MNMSRFAPYASLVAAILLGAFIIFFAGKVPVSYAPTVSTPIASSTLSVEPGFSFPNLSLPSLVPETNVASSTPLEAIAVPKAKTVTSPPPAVVQTRSSPAESNPFATSTTPAEPSALAPTPLAPFGNAELDSAATTLRSALVNIVCYMPAGSRIHSISGSGVIVDPKGIILTNAHIAQYFLLADRKATCSIRVGSPATLAYQAALIYISPLWLRENPTTISEAQPSGTGEFDFALLAVTKSSTATPLPAVFPFMPLAQVPLSTGSPVVIASYGAQFLAASQVPSSLFPTVVFGSVKDVFTFATNTIDVLALGGSAAAQEGSSGGGVANGSGKLVGTITTSTVEGATDTRSLDAITASYIRAEYATEMGSALDILLAEPTSVSVQEFSVKIPELESILSAHLP